MTTTPCPYKTPEVGTQVKVQCGDDVQCPFAERVSAAVVKGWDAFFQGADQPSNPEEARGWTFARNHKTVREGYIWTFEGTEHTADGWYAVISRTEPRCLDDVYNGTGTGLGTDTITEKVKLGD